jgi:hypothetical protein
MIFTNAESYYILLTLVPLFYIISLLNDKCKKRDTYFTYICDYYNPNRNLLTEKDISKKYKDIFLSKAFDKNPDIQELQNYLESLTAEYIINLVDKSINIYDSFIKIKFETKIYKILEIYIKCYNFDKNELDIYKFLLVAKIIDILSEVNVDIFYVSKELRRVLKQNKFNLNFFDNYCEYRKKLELNMENLFLNLEEVENLYNIFKTKT